MKQFITLLMRFSSVCVVGIYCAGGVAAEEALMEETMVTGGKTQIQTLSGSAQLLDEETLEQFDFVDLNQIMSTLPGVYIRQEDGFGLRPNIGVRGVTTERSQKITMMEDGVLIGPAPYSAPAAYYVPNIARMNSIELLKGPAAIQHGPHTVGGAINFVTQPIPEEREGFVDLTVGSDAFYKAQVFYADKMGDIGFWVDALSYGSDGFKELDSGGDTGFERNDFNVKIQWAPGELLGYEQIFTLKVGYSDESADETYLGLTKEDFNLNPVRRYAASQLAHFDSEHTQLYFSHVIEISEQLKLNTKFYLNDFERQWTKLDGFNPAYAVDMTGTAGVAINTILARPSVFTRELNVLRGNVNSNGTAAETLDVTNNMREYRSSGAQFRADYEFSTADFEHELKIGLRYHNDYIDRDHQTQGYLMQNGTLVNDGVNYGSKVFNYAETDALAVFLHDSIEWRNWVFTAGVRFEHIENEFEDYRKGTSQKKTQDMLAPAVGAFWQFSESLGFLVGLNRGFSPAGAAAAADIDSEESLNLEYGLRFNKNSARLELIGFFSDYDNLLGRCRASDSQCDVGEEFNGGKVEIAGFELTGEYFWALDNGWELPLTVSYTRTETAFQSSFQSSFSQWGFVQQGDELPYLPENIANIQLGLRAGAWEAHLALNYQDKMRDQAGRESVNSVLHTDAYTIINASVKWDVSDAWLLHLSVDNVTDEEAIVSWRPFGARPNRPRTIRARVKYSF